MARDFRVICVDNLETGPRMRPNDGRAVPTFVRQALEGKSLTVFGDGSQTRSFCLGWEPEIELETGLRRVLESFGREPVVA
jgi:dTDP-glucose 4,6-dehydratase